jgi:hypothetical protein
MKENWKRVGLTIIAAAMVLLCAGPLTAQDKEVNDMPFLAEKVKADKKLLVAENMQLNEAEAKAFWPVYEKYQAELFLLRTRTVNLIKNYSDNYDTMTDATAKKLLDEMLTIETLRGKLAVAYLPKFRAVLSERKAARYYQIENKINAGLYYELAARIPLVKAGKP